jgi:transcriptional regulator with XRE-family HTH domain
MEPQVGERVKAIREARGLSLRALAKESGLSVNTISLIERGDNSPTVASLHRLAAALGSSITDFFHDELRQTAVFVRRSERMAVARGDITMESLGTGLTHQKLEPFAVRIAPGAAYDGEVTHSGQEFVLCLKGRCRYRVDGQEYDLAPGDSLLFDSTRPHAFRNPGEEEAEIILVFQCSTSLDAARIAHLR